MPLSASGGTSDRVPAENVIRAAQDSPAPGATPGRGPSARFAQTSRFIEPERCGRRRKPPDRTAGHSACAARDSSESLRPQWSIRPLDLCVQANEPSGSCAIASTVGDYPTGRSAAIASRPPRAQLYLVPGRGHAKHGKRCRARARRAPWPCFRIQPARGNPSWALRGCTAWNRR